MRGPLATTDRGRRSPRRSSRARRTPARSAPGRSASENEMRGAAQVHVEVRLAARLGLGEEAHEHVGLLGREARARPRRGSRRAPDTGTPRTARRAAIDSITGLPNPSHVDGNTTRSHAAYASATRVGAAERDRHRRAFDDACERVGVAVLGRARDPELHRRGRASCAARCAARRTRAGNVLALDRARRLQHHERRRRRSRTCARVSRRGRRAAGRGRRSCGSSSRPRSRALRARAGCAG